jgi:hypothetical protein
MISARVRQCYEDEGQQHERQQDTTSDERVREKLTCSADPEQAPEMHIHTTVFDALIVKDG